MGNTSSKPAPEQDAGKHGSADSRTPLFLSIPYSNYHEDAEKDSVHGALRQLSTHDSPQDTIEPVAPSTPTPKTPVIVDEIEGHSNVSRPPSQVRPILRLSEIVDVEKMPDFSHVRSPSGNLLDRTQYMAHPDRPLTIRERQERILQRVRELERSGEVAEGSLDAMCEKMKEKSEGQSEPAKKPKSKGTKQSFLCCF